MNYYNNILNILNIVIHYIMQSYLRELYNDGINDGDMQILSKDNHIIKCHKFVILYATKILNLQDGNHISLDYNKNIIDIILNYTYSEKIVDIDLTVNEILSLFSLIHYLDMNDYILELKNHYIRTFPDKLTKNNWLHILKSIYGMQKYSDLLESIIPYIRDIAIVDDDILSIINMDGLDNTIKTFLFKISLHKVIELNKCLNLAIDEKNNNRKEKLNLLLTTSDELCYDSDDDNDEEDCNTSDKSTKKKKKKKIVSKN